MEEISFYYWLWESIVCVYDFWNGGIENVDEMLSNVVGEDFMYEIRM